MRGGISAAQFTESSSAEVKDTPAAMQRGQFQTSAAGGIQRCD